MHYLAQILNRYTKEVIHSEPFYLELELNYYLASCRVKPDEIVVVKVVSGSRIESYIYDTVTGTYTGQKLPSIA